jgi:hypothetical protein
MPASRWRAGTRVVLLHGADSLCRPRVFAHPPGHQLCYWKTSGGLLLPKSSAQPGWPGPLGLLDGLTPSAVASRAGLTAQPPAAGTSGSGTTAEGQAREQAARRAGAGLRRWRRT